jgi:hypothetical protein
VANGKTTEAPSRKSAGSRGNRGRSSVTSAGKNAYVTEERRRFAKRKASSAPATTTSTTMTCHGLMASIDNLSRSAQVARNLYGMTYEVKPFLRSAGRARVPRIDTSADTKPSADAARPLTAVTSETTSEPSPPESAGTGTYVGIAT